MTLDFKDYPFVSDNTRLGAGYSGVDGEVTVPVSTFGGIVPITINVIDHTGREVEYKFYGTAINSNNELIGYSYWEDAIGVPAINLILVPS